MSIQIIEAGPQVFYVAIKLLINSFGLSPQPLISIKVVKPWKLLNLLYKLLVLS